MEIIVKEQVNDNLAQARDRMKAEYDQGERDASLEASNWVYLRKESRKNGLSLYFEGTYSVLSSRGPTIKLGLRNGREKVVHLNRCKKCQFPGAERQFGVPNVDKQHTQIDSESSSEADL